MADLGIPTKAAQVEMNKVTPDAYNAFNEFRKDNHKRYKRGPDLPAVMYRTW